MLTDVYADDVIDIVDGKYMYTVSYHDFISSYYDSALVALKMTSSHHLPTYFYLFYSN
jgi:hypothetical protein